LKGRRKEKEDRLPNSGKIGLFTEEGGGSLVGDGKEGKNRDCLFTHATERKGRGGRKSLNRFQHQGKKKREQCQSFLHILESKGGKKGENGGQKGEGLGFGQGH